MRRSIRKMPKLPKPRKKRTIYIKPELHQWIEEQIEKGKFQNFSHTIEVALEKLKGRSDES
jgi:Arc/MetJ-type ribon-helix-helix transcriptional regulator